MLDLVEAIFPRAAPVSEMNGQSFLLTVAQIGLGLAGFTGIIVALRDNERGWGPQDIAGVRLMLEHTFTVVLLAMLPFPFFYMVKVEATVWLVSSFLLAIFLAFEFYYQGRVAVRISRRFGTTPRSGRAIVLTVSILTAFFFFLQLGNVIFWQSLAGYAWGLLWLLIVAGLQFFVLILNLHPQTTHRS